MPSGREISSKNQPQLGVHVHGITLHLQQLQGLYPFRRGQVSQLVGPKKGLQAVVTCGRQSPRHRHPVPPRDLSAVVIPTGQRLLPSWSRSQSRALRKGPPPLLVPDGRPPPQPQSSCQRSTPWEQLQAVTGLSSRASPCGGMGGQVVGVVWSPSSPGGEIRPSRHRPGFFSAPPRWWPKVSPSVATGNQLEGTVIAVNRLANASGKVARCRQHIVKAHVARKWGPS